jgi:AraC-like DNA-binding protein
VQRNLPTGGIELQCRIGALPQLVGPLTAASVQVLPAHTTVVGVRFRPGTAAALLGLPADELVDRTVQLDEVWGGTAARLSELLAGAPGAEAALELLQRYLVYQQARTDRPDPLVVEAVGRLMPWRSIEIGRLTTHLAILASQLRRRFLLTVGVGPKTLQRTLRFQGTSRSHRPRRHPGGPGTGSRLADLAAEAGYADHAHLSRECLRMTGLAPSVLLGRRSDRCGCGHDHAASYLPFLAGRERAP